MTSRRHANRRPRTAPLRTAAAVRATLDALEPRQLFAVANPQPLTGLTLSNTDAVTIDLAPRFTTDISGRVVRMAMAFGVGAGQVTGNIDVELFDQTPLSRDNFLAYVNAGRYTNSIYHRSVPGFVIQGGGFAVPNPGQVPQGGVASVPTFANLPNEYTLSPRDAVGKVNTRGTLSMAKLGGDPDSATSQWFVNLADNSGKDATGTVKPGAAGSNGLDQQNGGFTTFARVIGDGMTLVDQIAALTAFDASSVYGGALTDVPLKDAAPPTLPDRDSFVRVTNASVVADGTLSYTVDSSNTAAFTASVTNGVLSLTPVAPGTSTITVTVSDGVSSTPYTFTATRPDPTVPDTTAPVAALAPVPDQLTTAAGIDFTLTASDDVALDTATLTDSLLAVTLPGGATAQATRTALTTNGAGVTTATYRLSPTGSFAPGSYTVALPASALRDLAGNAAAPVQAAFTLAAPPTDTTAPVASLLAVPAQIATASSIEFTLIASDDTALDTATLTDGLLLVTPPGGAPVAAARVGLTTQGGRTVATYRLTRGTSDFAAGTYTLSFPASALRDTAGNAAPAVQTTFTVAAPPAPAVGGLLLTYGTGSGVATSTVPVGAILSALDTASLAGGVTSQLVRTAAGGLALLRFTAAGVADITFGSGGAAALTLPAGVTLVSASLDADGKPLVLGTTPAGPVLVRYTTAGTFDATAGTGGVVSLPAGTYTAARSIADGYLLVAPDAKGLTFSKVGQTGALVTAFGKKGVLSVSLKGSPSITKLAPTTGADLIAVGSAAGKPLAVRMTPTAKGKAVVLTKPFATAPAGTVATDAVLDDRDRLLVTLSSGTATFLLRLLPKTYAVDKAFTDGANAPGVVAAGSANTAVTYQPDADAYVTADYTAAGDLTAATLTARRQDAADLAPTAPVVKATPVKRGATYSTKFNLANAGTLPANGTFSARLVLSTNDTLGDSDDIVLSTTGFTLKNQLAGAVKSFSVKGKLDPALAAGPYRLFVQVVPGTAADDNAANNTVLAAAPLTVRA